MEKMVYLCSECFDSEKEEIAIGRVVDSVCDICEEDIKAGEGHFQVIRVCGDMDAGPINQTSEEYGG